VSPTEISSYVLLSINPRFMQIPSRSGSIHYGPNVPSYDLRARFKVTAITHADDGRTPGKMRAPGIWCGSKWEKEDCVSSRRNRSAGIFGSSAADVPCDAGGNAQVVLPVSSVVGQ
jgi:hypothetical protein